MQSKEAVAEHRAGGEQTTCGSREHDTNCVSVLQDRKKNRDDSADCHLWGETVTATVSKKEQNRTEKEKPNRS